MMQTPDMPTAPLAFEDLAVGQIYTAGPIQVSADRIKSFAGEFDPQEQHIDETAAQSTGFGELVASGWHTAAIAMRLMYEGLIKRFDHGGMGLGVDRLRWLAPVRPGDALSARMTMETLRPSASKPDFGVVTMIVQVSDQHDKPVLQMTVSSLVPKKTR